MKCYIILILSIFLGCVNPVYAETLIMYPNTHGTYGIYGSFLDENLYNSCFSIDDINGHSIFIDSDYDNISYYDSYKVTSEGTPNYDGLVYVNFIVNNVSSVENAYINTTHTMNAGVPIDDIHMGLYCYVCNSWLSLTSSNIKNVKVNMSYVLSDLDLLCYKRIVDNTLYFSVGMWTNGLASTDSSVDYVRITIDYTPYTPISDKQTIIFKNDLSLYDEDKIIMFKDNEFIDKYDYAENIYYDNSSNYTFIINEDIIDEINNENFLIVIFNKYGYLIISMVGLICILGVIVYIYKRFKK